MVIKITHNKGVYGKISYVDTIHRRDSRILSHKCN